MDGSGGRRWYVAWREDYLGDRDLTRWPSAAGKLLLSASTWVVRRAKQWLPERELPWLVLGMIAVVGGAMVVVMTAASAEIYDAVTDREGVAGLDRPVLDAIVTWRSNGLDAAVTEFTDLGGAVIMSVIVVGAAALLCWWWRRWTPALLLAIAGLGSLLMTVVGKQVVGRARPPESLAVPPFEDSPSFPSGHTLNSWVLLLLIGYLVAVRTTSRVVTVVAPVLAFTFAVAMGLSRVYLGHHWLTDVLVGWTLGTAWLAIVITGHRLALTVRRSGGSATPPEATTTAPDT
jgi:undecaprenyl-diphosphatase